MAWLGRCKVGEMAYEMIEQLTEEQDFKRMPGVSRQRTQSG